MRNLSALLERLVKSVNKDGYIKELVIMEVKSWTGATLKEDKIALRNEVLEIDASAPVKSEIRLREREILKALNNTHRIFITRILFK
jgi:hypothetical protein